jgi:hypothetical protein
MRRRTKLAFAMLLSSCLFSGNYSRLNAQVNSFQVSSEDTKAIEAILHSNPSDHVTEDVSFTNIFGTVRYYIPTPRTSRMRRASIFNSAGRSRVCNYRFPVQSGIRFEAK